MRFEASGLRLRYPKSPLPALDGVSTTARSGALKVVAGPNGCGKTTLLRTLLGRIAPESGSVRLGGRRLESWRGRERALAVGVVTQGEEFPFPLTVRELVAMGRYPHLGPLRSATPRDRSEVDAALEECDLASLGARDVRTLSGGELQRARIARALAQRPAALVFDEPTASLDLSHAMGIFRLLRRKADEGRTVIVVVHQLELAARFADELLLLDAGRVAADGPPEEVLSADLLSKVFRWPVAVGREPVTGAVRVTPLD